MLRKLLIALLFLIAAPGFAIEEINKGDVLDLSQCIEIALKNSPILNKAKAKIKIAKANVGEAKAVWTPGIGIGTGFNGSETRTGSHSFSDRYLGVDASISQMIYDFGKTNSGIKLQKFNLIASEYELEYLTLETIYSVKEAYFGVLAAKANKDVQIQNVEINERQFEQIKSYYEEGIKSRIDYVNAEVNLSNAKYELLSAQDKYCDAMVKLNKSLYLTNNPDYAIAPVEKFNINNDITPVTLIQSHELNNNGGLDKEEEIKEVTLSGIIRENEIVKNHTLSKFDKTFEEVLEFANNNRPDLKSYIAVKDAMNESLKYTKRSWFPVLSVSAGYGYNRNDGVNRNNFGYGADFSIPLFKPVDLKYRIDSANAQLESASEDVNLIYQNIYYDVELALYETKIYENQIPLVLNRIKLAKENFELADGRYLEGIGNYIELQDARSKYLNAQQEYINTVYQYSLARANLDFVMGVK